MRIMSEESERGIWSMLSEWVGEEGGRRPTATRAARVRPTICNSSGASAEILDLHRGGEEEEKMELG